MTRQLLLAWWNLIYMVPFLLALLYLVVYTASGWTFGDADADIDADADLDTDVDAHLDVDADGDVDAHDVEHAHDVQGSNGGSHVFAALMWLGVGRVPLSIVLMVLLLSWGVIGFAVNQVAQPWVLMPWRVALASLPIAFIGSLFLSRVVAMGMARFLPINETYARRRHELLGSVGTAILPIDARFGLASVRDEFGNLCQVPCRTEDDAGPISKDSRVKLVGFSAKEGIFNVIPN